MELRRRRLKLLRSSVRIALGPLVALTLACASGGPPSAARSDDVTSPAAEFSRQTAGLEERRGLIGLYPDPERGRLLAAFPAPAAGDGRIGEYLHVEALVSGLGSNPVGLDRGQIGATRRVVIRRLGGRVLVEAPNLAFRASAESPPERLAVRQSFATSVLWSGAILGRDDDGRLLVDFTDFVVRDAHGVAARLAAAGQGSFSLDRERSVVALDSCLSFPLNVEIESLLTFAGSSPGPEVRAVAPDPSSVSLVLHQALAAVPPPGYRPRESDPRMGSFGIAFSDYSAPLDRPVERRWIARHRLEKSEPGAERSPVREPIVYYVDRGAPEPVRSALVEGASWWRQAFEAAGFEDAFRVELLPEGAHPLDLRYNVIQWVHRATRGWSYGGGVVDPLTGEIVKGHVSLGSLRVRQDRLLFEGLVGAARSGSGAVDDPIELALARIRQLAAHEVGHTLGLAHNFAASALGRASVMDYPAPLVEVTGEGELDLSRAYAVGVGEWDLAAIRWAYAEPPPGRDEAEFLDELVRATLDRGLIMLSDGDARPAGAGHPMASLWDNGADPVAALERTMRVRRIALERLDASRLREGEPRARLEEVLATVYLHHRFQLAAAAKLIAGVDYRHALSGDGQPAARAVPGPEQRRAIESLLATLEPAALDLPEPLLRDLPPRPPGWSSSREQFGSRTRPAFDALAAAATATDLTLRALLDPTRAARLVDQHRRDSGLPGLSEVVGRSVEALFGRAEPEPLRRGELLRVAQRGLVERLIALSTDPDAAPWVRARVDAALSRLLHELERRTEADAGGRAHVADLAAEISRHLSRPGPPSPLPSSPLEAPPGDPIGAEATWVSGCGFEAPAP